MSSLRVSSTSPTEEICSKDDYENILWSGLKLYEDGGDIPGINSNTASRIELLEDDEGHFPLAILPLATALGILGGDAVG